jgi:hypothetical protein
MTRLVVLPNWLLSHSRGEVCRCVCLSLGGGEGAELYTRSRICQRDNMIDRCVVLEAAIATES